MNPQPPASRFLSLACLLILSVAGLLLANSLTQPGPERLCSTSGCQAVLASRYSHIGKWPLAAAGAIFYAAMVFFWGICISFRPGKFRSAALFTASVLSMLAVVISLLLIFLQFWIIRAVCPLCLVSAGMCIGIELTILHLRRYPDWLAQPLAGIAAWLVLAVAAFRIFPAAPPIVARVGGDIITAAQMAKGIAPPARQAEWEIYRAEKDWLDQKLTDLLVQREAAARHISPGDLVQSEVNAPVDRQLDEFMKANGAKLQPEDRVIVRQEMLARFKADRAEAFVHSLMRKYGAVEYLSPPIIDESDLARLPGEHRGGDAKAAPIRLVVFSDFGCEYCAHTAQSIAAVMKKHGDEISLTFHYLPLDIHYRASEAAVAAECAAEQNKFWPYHDSLMSHDGRLSGIDFAEIAKTLDLDQNKFRQCIASNSAAQIVNQSQRAADRLGIDTVPAVFLNGQRIGGDLSEAELENWMDNAVLRTHR